MHGLHARRIVDMGDGRNVGARDVELVDAEQRLFLAVIARRRSALHVGDQQHVGRVAVELEPVGDVLAQHRRREGPEALAVLDLEVQRLLHRRRARIAEDRARPERARAELHAALHPADRLRRAASAAAVCSITSASSTPSRNARPHRSSRRSMSLCAEVGPEIGARHPVAIARRVSRGLPRNRCQAASAAPSAPPASPAAGWTQIFSNVPSRSSLPLATQLSATPPARQRLRQAVLRARARASAAARPPRSPPGSRPRDPCGTGVSRSLSGLRTGSPNSSANCSLVMVRPVQ